MRVKSDELLLAMMRSGDPTINFNPHEREESDEIFIGFSSDSRGVTNVVYTTKKVYMIHFNE